MKIKTHIAFLLLLLFFSAGCANAQKIMRIPLEKGYNNNPSIQLDSLSILPVNLAINTEPWDGRNLSLQLQLEVTDRQGDYTAYLGYYEKADNDQLRNTFPRAIGKYLLTLDVREDGTDLLIRPLKFGYEFIIDFEKGRSAIVEALTITCNVWFTADLLNSDHGYGGYEISLSFEVSDGNSKDTLQFEYVRTYRGETTEIENNNTREWKNYKIEILDNFTEPFKLRVTRIER